MTVNRATYFGRLHNMANIVASMGSEYAKVSEQAATGLKVTTASDDPAQMERIHTVKEASANQEIWIDNSNYAYSILAVADAALQDMADVLTEARELAVAMASETYEASTLTENQAIADVLLEEMIQLANVTYGDRFLFAGTDWDNEAYDTTATYQGSTNESEIMVGDRMNVTSGFDGSSFLQGTGDPFLALQNLSAALAAGDHSLVQSSLDDFDAAIDQITRAMTEVGGEMILAEDAGNLAVDVQISLQTELSNLVDADVAYAYTRLAEIQTAYQAALSVTASLQTGTLFDLI